MLKIIILLTVMANSITIPDYTCTQVLKAIACVESSDKAIGTHPDGVSIGRHGVTRIAIRELSKTIDISENIDLKVDWINEYCAWEYLRLMYERHECTNWIEAAGWYHGGSASNRAEYIERIKKSLESDTVPVARVQGTNVAEALNLKH